MEVINGNNIDILKQYPDNHFDSVVTDPPYGLGKEPNAQELMKDWIDKGYHEVSGSGFMGKEWDAFVPQPIFWKEVFRVLKPGGHVLSFYGSRTYDWGVMAMRFAGFEVRDTITWHFGSGFPKSHNISKAIDKMYGAEREIVGSKITGTMNNKGGASVNKEGWDGGQKEVEITAASTDQAKQWDGWGSALKPASEYICLARKPLEKGLSIAENVLKWGVGAINIDGCRVGNDNITLNGYGIRWAKNGSEMPYIERNPTNHQGRFPANLILSHSELCQHVGTKKVKSGIASEKGGGFGKGQIYGSEKTNGTSDNIGGGYGEETIEDWNCHEDCPIKILDEQSGESKSSNTKRNRNTIGSFGMPNDNTPEYSDKGGASRFFYIAKASKSERNKGLEGFEEKEPQHDFGTDFGESRATRTHTQTKNFHPTVKPIKLMQYLVRLVTPPGGIVLDPFCGSGTTGIACKLEGFDFVGCEQDAEYTKIAKARIDNFVEEKETKKKSIKPIQNSLFDA